MATEPPPRTPDDTGIPPLVTWGHPLLAQPSAPVPIRSVRKDPFQERLRVLERAMMAYRGIGIAAPQIGWFERFFLLGRASTAADGAEEIAVEVWVNPEIVQVSSEQGWAWEGCLSVPGLRGWIRRPLAVAVRGHTAQGQRVSRELAGWPARVFQHEYDHLDGILFPGRARDWRHLVTLDQLAHRDTWPTDWPAPGAARAPLGEVVPDPDT
jgi:peptide deformylase